MEPESRDQRMLKQITGKLAAAIEKVLKQNVTGIYLTGSAVLDDWHYGKSDIDLVVIVSEPVPYASTAQLQSAVKALEAEYKKLKMEIQYIPKALLDKSGEEASPILNYDGKRHGVSRRNMHPVMWYTLNKHGIAVFGKPVRDLNLETNQGELCAYVLANVNTYWKKWLQDAATLFSVKGILSFSNWTVEWCVCGLSRMYYTLMEIKITSKRGAVEYMLDKAPGEYRELLMEALAIRKGTGQRYFKSKRLRRKMMRKYMEYVIRLCGEIHTQTGSGP